jgi:hypothetical protein
MMTRTRITPRPDYLDSLTTLRTQRAEDGTPAFREFCHAHGIDLVQELKLETEDARYWLTTGGMEEPEEGLDNAFVAGYVSPEYRLPDGTWETDCSYGPADVALLQGRDYLDMLVEERDHLAAELEERHSWETVKRHEATVREIEDVLAQRKAPDA